MGFSDCVILSITPSKIYRNNPLYPSKVDIRKLEKRGEPEPELEPESEQEPEPNFLKMRMGVE